jgi:hypothetical protein
MRDSGRENGNMWIVGKRHACKPGAYIYHDSQLPHQASIAAAWIMHFHPGVPHISLSVGRMQTQNFPNAGSLRDLIFVSLFAV